MQRADLRAILEQLDYQPLLDHLERHRWNGRPGYPAKVMWRAYCASFLLNLPSTNALIRRLHWDSDLRALCGFVVLPGRRTFNRFVQRLSRHSDLVEAAMARVTDKLKEYLPDLGDVVAIDSTAVKTHSNHDRKPASDRQARWGIKTSTQAKSGKEYFFGFKVHAVADATYGVPLAFQVTPANRRDSLMLPPVMERAERHYRWWRPRVALADKAYDGKPTHEWLDARGIVAIIPIKRLPKGELHGGIYTQTGTPVCLGNVPMEYAETDPATGHRLYICREGGCHLKGSGSGAVIYCDSEVWEDPSTNLRLFGRVRRDSPEWDAYYSKRKAVERCFKSMKQSRRLERHYVRGLRHVRLHAAMACLTFQATALAHVQAGRVKQMAWMVRRVA